MGAEDFGFYTQYKPATRFMYGGTKPGTEPTKAHNGHFCIDEDCFPIPAKVLVQYVLENMN